MGSRKNRREITGRGRANGGLPRQGALPGKPDGSDDPKTRGSGEEGAMITGEVKKRRRRAPEGMQGAARSGRAGTKKHGTGPREWGRKGRRKSQKKSRSQQPIPESWAHRHTSGRAEQWRTGLQSGEIAQA